MEVEPALALVAIKIFSWGKYFRSVVCARAACEVLERCVGEMMMDLDMTGAIMMVAGIRVKRLPSRI